MVVATFLDEKNDHLAELMAEAGTTDTLVGIDGINHSEVADTLRDLAERGLTEPTPSGTVLAENLVKDNGRFAVAKSLGMEAVHTVFEAGWPGLERMAALDAFVANAGDPCGTEEERCLEFALDSLRAERPAIFVVLGMGREQSGEEPISPFEERADELGYGALIEGFYGSSEGMGFFAGVLAEVGMSLDVLIGLSTGLLMNAFSELSEDAARRQ